jgi:Protein of unknown function (DUF3363)
VNVRGVRARVCQPSTLRIVIWPEASSAQNNMAADSAHGSRVWVLIHEAMGRRVDHLVEEGLARRQEQRVVFARDLLSTLRRRELNDAAAKLSAETGLAYHPSAEGEHVAGTYRQRITLASGRFAMIDDGLGFQLVPWRACAGAKAGTACIGHNGSRRSR